MINNLSYHNTLQIGITFCDTLNLENDNTTLFMNIMYLTVLLKFIIKLQIQIESQCPNFDMFNFQGAFITPSRSPSILILMKFLHTQPFTISPRFRTVSTIFEFESTHTNSKRYIHLQKINGSEKSCFWTM